MPVMLLHLMLLWRLPLLVCLFGELLRSVRLLVAAAAAAGGCGRWWLLPGLVHESLRLLRQLSQQLVQRGRGCRLLLVLL